MNINTCFSLRAKYRLMGGLGGQFCRNLNYWSMPLPMHKMLLQRYSYFKKGCRKQMCPQQSQMVIWDMTNALFLTTVAVKPCFPLALASICPWRVSCYSFKFLWRTVNSKPPTIPIRIVTIKLENVCPPLSSFNRCPSLPSVATDDCRKHFQCLLFCLK